MKYDPNYIVTTNNKNMECDGHMDNYRIGPGYHKGLPKANSALYQTKSLWSKMKHIHSV